MSSGHHLSTPNSALLTLAEELGEENVAFKEACNRSSKCCRELREIFSHTSNVSLPSPVENIWAVTEDNHFTIGFPGLDLDLLVLFPSHGSRWKRTSETPRHFAEILLVRDGEAMEGSETQQVDSTEAIASEVRKILITYKE